MEKLTRDLADKAQSIIDEVENHGGMTKALRQVCPSQDEESAARRQARIDSG